WQRFEDDLRKDNPLLSARQWMAALGAHGFDHVAAFPGEASKATLLGQHVLIARHAGAEDGRPSVLSPEPTPERVDQLAAPPTSFLEQFREVYGEQCLTSSEGDFYDLLSRSLSLS